MSENEIAQGEQAASIKQLRQLTDRLIDTVNAKKPSKAQLAELHKALKDAPALVGRLGDMSIQIRRRLIENMTPQPGLHIAVRAHAEQMARELGAEQASLLERLLIDQVVIAWLRLQSIELTYQHNFEQSITLTLGIYLERRLSAAHRRYLQAIESLARVRRLLKRAPIQINIAQQQIVQSTGVANVLNAGAG